MSNAPSPLEQAAEAVCSALWRTDWQFLGESAGGRKTFFERGDVGAHEGVQVVIERRTSDGGLVVNAFWWSRGVQPHKRMRRYWVISTTKPLDAQAEYVVTKLLELYRDVVAQTGLAIYGSPFAKA